MKRALGDDGLNQKILGYNARLLIGTPFDRTLKRSQMPIYEYQCQACGHKLEKLHRMNDELLTDCPKCEKSSLSKLVSAAAFRLKGNGWYETDFKTGSKKNVFEDSSSSTSEDSGGGTSESKSDTKSDSKSDSSKNESSGDNKTSSTTSSKTKSDAA